MGRVFMSGLGFPLWVIVLARRLNKRPDSGVITIEDVSAYLGALRAIEHLVKRQDITGWFDRMVAEALLGWITREKQGAEFMFDALIVDKTKLALARTPDWEVYSLPIISYGPADLEPRE